MKTHMLLGLSVTFNVVTCKGKPAPPATAASASAPATQVSNSSDMCRAAAYLDRPTVRWASDTGFTADLNYDGAPDRVVWGTEGDSLFVFSIVECVQGKPGQVWNFPLRAVAVFGTLHLQVSLTNPALGAGYLEQNCMGAETTSVCKELVALDQRLLAAYERGGRGLEVGVPDRRKLRMYWDPTRNQFVAWGL